MKNSLEPAFDMRRVVVFTALISCFFLVLIGRLYVLQVREGASYLQKSEENFVQERRLAHTRGLILDQTGKVLVDNRPSHDIMLTAAFLPDSARALRQLLHPLGLARQELRDFDQLILDAVDEQLTVRLTSLDDVDDCEEIEERQRRYEIRGVQIAPRPDGCDVLVDAAVFPSRASVFKRLQRLLELPDDEMKQRTELAMQKSSGLARFKPRLFIEDIDYLAYARVEQAISLGDLPGIDVAETQKRRYREGAHAAHILGYLNEISPEELKKQAAAIEADELPEDASRYVLGDLVGRKGVELAYESTLRGRDGVERVVVDAKGRTKGKGWAETLLGEGRIDPPQAGHSVVLAIDDDMQRMAEEAFNGQAGSVVALEVDTGYVLAMASFPDYDPNIISGPRARQLKRQMDLDTNRPWTNKAIQDHYAPGSTFKAITAAAGLRNNLITETSTRMCPGYFRLGRATWRCYNRGGHGAIALIKALQYSCDTYFYSLGYDLGPDRHADTARLFSFGSRTGIDIGGESPGIMPDRAYYERRFGAYTPGLVVNNAIGQGDVTVTPLQLAVAYATIANGGKVMKPQMVREVLDAEGNVVEEHPPVQMADIGIAPEQMALLSEALSHVTEAGGTASGLYWRRDRYADMSAWLRDTGITIVGKTGTAQVVRLSKSVAHVRAEDMPYEQRDHAWFVGFAPKEHPEVVVVTMTEHGGFGGSTSGPVTAEVLRSWFTSVRGKGRYADLPEIVYEKKVFAPRTQKTDAVETDHVDHAPEETGDAPAGETTP